MRGLERRVASLGESYVHPAMERAASDSSEAALQSFVNESIWSGIWLRPQLALRDRSLITLALLAAANQEDELELHVRAALRHGLTREEVFEAFMHIGAYAGIPRANLGFRCARKVFAMLDAELESTSK
jgi:alkylhydroperoxidase/carboxymuconolactone decarboxylase family protein YurZ